MVARWSAALLLGAATGTAILGAAAVNAQRSRVSDADPDRRARTLERQMTPEEKVRITHGIMALPFGSTKIPDVAPLGAGYVEGISRLGIPALTETDASLGVAWVGGVRKDGATALPSGLAMGATWNPELVRLGGQIIAGEASAKGFNVLLAGGINLVRDPRGGRDFEYLGEDPLHSGILGGAAVAGIQSQHVISTVKHFAINSIETGRQFHNAIISDDAFRMSDLLAFEIAIEQGRPGAVMCAYNKVNGQSACGNGSLLNDVLKSDWGFKGWVMSDWGAVHGLDFALRGLDQQSGAQLDDKIYFGDRLASEAGRDAAYRARVSDMDRRILRSMFAVGVDRFPPKRHAIDVEAGARAAQEVAEQAIVLLQNRAATLPLSSGTKRIAIIGGYADSGVLSGGGSSQTEGIEGPAVAVPTVGGPFAAILAQSYQPSSPMKALQAALPGAEIVFRDGRYVNDAVSAAKQADIAIIFATQWRSEGFDVPDLSMPQGQDDLISAVAKANPKTIVVLETGGPVLMPWLPETAAVLEAWYPGARGGDAIANILVGKQNPSGRLPVTFPASTDQLPRPELPGLGTVEPDFMGKGRSGQTLDINYNIEGSDVGYRWFARQHAAPLFPFGFGLSYTTFSYGLPILRGGTTPSAHLSLSNTGERSGAEVMQLYLIATPDGPTLRLAAFKRLEIAAGAHADTDVTIDPRLLANWSQGHWHLKKGIYRFALGTSATSLGPPADVVLQGRSW